MSSALKGIIAVIVIAIIAWLVWWSGWVTIPSQKPAPTIQPVATTTAPQAEAAPPQNMNGMAAANDASDGAITQDAAAIDTQLQGLTQDSTAVDSSMNDKAVAQSY